MKINIVPLSINKAFKGRRFKTDDYKQYERELLLLLKPKRIPKGKLTLIITVGYSSKLADIDNFLKPFIDILQLKYQFNDRDIYKLVVEKVIVDKGNEFIMFDIKKYQ